MASLMYCGVKAVIRNKEGKILFVKQHTPSLPSLKWYVTLPGGRLGTNEDPYEGLRREIMEEVKLEITVGEPLGMYYFLREDGVQTTLTVFECVAHDLEKIDISKNDDTTEEFHGCEWLTPAELLAKDYPMSSESFRQFVKTLQ